MARVAKFALAIAATLGVAFLVLTMPSEVRIAEFASLPPANLANGETIFNIGGCASCHATPGQADKSRLGGGLAIRTAFGTFKTPNISSDANAGIGGWSEQQFATAMLKGVGRRGKHLYPSFPYPSYQRMRLADVRDLFAYLGTLTPDTKPNEPHELPFPFSLRRGLGLWKLLYLDGKSFKPDPTRSPELNRGAYLVEGPGHCGECHSPRNAFGAIDPSRKFAGGPDPEGKGYTPNITPHADGIADWSVKDIADLLQTGTLPQGMGEVGDGMADVVSNTSKLSVADRSAMAAYLKSLPARPGKRPQ